MVNESGIYTFLLRSGMPKAKPFRRWVTKEVLPTIRKTGSYSTRPQPQVSQEAWLDAAWAKALTGDVQMEILRQKAALRSFNPAPSGMVLTLETIWEASLEGVRKKFVAGRPLWLILEKLSRHLDHHSFFGRLIIHRDSLINAVVSVRHEWATHEYKDYQAILAREMGWMQPEKRTYQHPGQPKARDVFWGFHVSAVSQPPALVEIARLAGNFPFPKVD
jgi:hypothetical protein